MVVFGFAAASASAETEIHRCLLDDGTVAFQETPCPKPTGDTRDEGQAGATRKTGDTPAANDDASVFASPFDEPTPPATPAEPALPVPASKNRGECEKTARDAIDAIDAELQTNADSSEQARDHLAELLTLTEQLRACKRL